MITAQFVCVCALMLAALVIAALLWALRPRTLTEALIMIGMTAVTIGAMGCSSVPLTPGQVRQILNEVNR